MLVRGVLFSKVRVAFFSRFPTLAPLLLSPVAPIIIGLPKLEHFL